MTVKPENTEIEAFIYLFSVDLSPRGVDKKWYFYAADGRFNTAITTSFTGVGGVDLESVVFYPTIMSISELKTDSSGKYPRPKLGMAVLDAQIAAIVNRYDLVGGGITYNIRYVENGAITTNNYDNGYYVVFRKTSETRFYIEYELAIPFDLGSDKIPKRVITSNTCTWVYTSAECGWNPEENRNYYDSSDTVVGVDKDSCGKRVSSCKARFGTNPLRFGGFPLIAS